MPNCAIALLTPVTLAPLVLFQLAALEKAQGEKASWGAWLRSVTNEIPDDRFRAFQRESFALAQRFLSQESSPPPPSAPVHQQSTLPHVPTYQPSQTTHYLPPQPQQSYITMMVNIHLKFSIFSVFLAFKQALSVFA